MAKKTQKVLSRKRPNKGRNHVSSIQCHWLANHFGRKIIKVHTFWKETIFIKVKPHYLESTFSFPNDIQLLIKILDDTVYIHTYIYTYSLVGGLLFWGKTSPSGDQVDCLINLKIGIYAEQKGPSERALHSLTSPRPLQKHPQQP